MDFTEKEFLKKQLLDAPIQDFIGMYQMHKLRDEIFRDALRARWPEIMQAERNGKTEIKL